MTRPAAWARAIGKGAARRLAGLVLALAALVAPALAETPGRAGVATAIVPFETSAFPYRGRIPDQDRPFLDVVVDGRPAHTAPRAGRLFEDTTYAGRDVLLAVPHRLDLGRPVAIVVFFHGNRARLGRDVRDRQRVPEQLAASGLNAVLVAPQFALDALDSSAGAFWDRGHFARFLAEAADRLAAMIGRPEAAAMLARAPVVIVAYSGGYLPAAFALERGGAGDRVRGVVLLDGLYAEEKRFADWIARRGPAFFFSAHSPSTREPNRELRRLLAERGVAASNGLPRVFAPGDVAFLATGDDVVHQDFLTRAFAPDPLRVVLSRIRDLGR